jgi:transglutaminase-like putative cysteine protease
VLTSHSDGVLHGVHETLPPALFLRATEMTGPDSMIAEFAADSAAGARDRIGALHRLNRALHKQFTFDAGRPELGLSAAAAFRKASATPRDMAQIFAVAARSLGAPARYVSGYHHNDHETIHFPTPHGWAEAYVDRLGWVGFDPCTGMSPEEHYVRVAMALDSVGAAPVAGSRLGQGGEELDVDVVVQRED